jgi:hypothetical protein
MDSDTPALTPHSEPRPLPLPARAERFDARAQGSSDATPQHVARSNTPTRLDRCPQPHLPATRKLRREHGESGENIARLRKNLILTRVVRLTGREAELRAAVRLGTVIRLRRGVYIAANRWRALDPDSRYLTKIHAVAATFIRPIFSGHSAAALWGLPAIGDWPDRVFILSPGNAGGRVRAGVVEQMYNGGPNPVSVNGILLTSPARTVLDVSRIADFASAVAIADAALHVSRESVEPLCSRDELQQQYDAMLPFRGSRKGKGVIDFADGLSGSTGETLSRVNIHLLGFPAPILQHPFFDALGLIGYSDFWWPEFRLIGEFDGKAKYMREEFLHGESTADAVYREKLREDRMRALGLRVVRWTWDEAMAVEPLREKLIAAGLPHPK